MAIMWIISIYYKMSFYFYASVIGLAHTFEYEELPAAYATFRDGLGFAFQYLYIPMWPIQSNLIKKFGPYMFQRTDLFFLFSLLTVKYAFDTPEFRYIITSKH